MLEITYQCDVLGEMWYGGIAAKRFTLKQSDISRAYMDICIANNAECVERAMRAKCGNFSAVIDYAIEQITVASRCTVDRETGDTIVTKRMRYHTFRQWEDMAHEDTFTDRVLY